MREIWDEQIPARQGRSNPRVVKKTRSKFLSKNLVTEVLELNANSLTSLLSALLRA